MKSPDFEFLLGQARKQKENLSQGGLLARSAASRLFRRSYDERGSAGTDWAIGLAIGAFVLLAGHGTLNYIEQTKQAGRIEALQTQVAALTTPAATPEIKTIISESSPTMMYWYKGEEFTIRPSNGFRPSMVNKPLKTEEEREGLLNWENVLEINGVNMTEAKLFRINDPLITYYAVDKPSTGNAISDFLRRDRFTSYHALRMQAVVRNNGQLEKRSIYLPLNNPESQGFVEGYDPPRGDRPLEVYEKEGRYYHQVRQIGENYLGEFPANQIGIVTVIPQ